MMEPSQSSKKQQSKKREASKQVAQSATRALNWQTVASAASLLLVILASTWTIFQTQFSYTTKESEQIRQDLLRRETEIKERIDAMQKQLDDRRSLFIDQNQHKEFEKRLDERFGLLQQQVIHLEQTRPTTGELASVSKQLEQSVGKLTTDAITRTDVEKILTAHDTKDRLDAAALRRELDDAKAAFNRDVSRMGERQDKFTTALDQIYNQLVTHLRDPVVPKSGQ